MSWKIEKLGNVVTHRKEFITIDNSVEYKRCRVQVNRKGVVLRDFVKGIVINTKKQQVCREGDFLVAEIDAKVGGYGFVPADLEGAIVSSHYFLFEVDESKLLKDYLGWLIKTDIIQEQITSKGSTNYAAIRPHHVLNFEIPLPSVGKQAVIVHRLNNINEEYTSLDKALDQQQTYLQLLRQTILQEAVQGKLTKQDPADEPATELLKRIKVQKEKLDSSGASARSKKEKELPPITEDEIPFELPEGWVWCRLSNISKYIQRGKSPNYTTKSQFPVLSQKCIKWSGVDFSFIKFITEASSVKFESQRFLEEGDLLWNSTGDGTLGRITYYIKNKDYDKVVVDTHITIIRVFKPLINYNYILFLLSSPFIQNNLKITGSTKQTELNVSVIRNQIVPLPPLAEQQCIVAKVQQLQQQLSQLDAQVQQNRQYAQQLLQSVLKEAFKQTEKVEQVAEVQ